MTLLEKDKTGLQEIRRFINEFLETETDCNELVREYIKQAAEKDEALLPFLWGRKYRTEYAWKTLKRNAEVRFIECSEMFPATIPAKTVAHFETKQLWGVLKTPDNLGRQVIVFNQGAWDPDECTFMEISVVFVRIFEHLLQTEHVSKNGVTCILQCSGVQFKHARQWTISIMRTLIKVFYQAFPIQIKCVVYVNVPKYLYCAIMLGWPFFPKKLKKRMIFSFANSENQEVHSIVPPEKLPTWLGGTLPFDQVVDPNYSVSKMT